MKSKKKESSLQKKGSQNSDRERKAQKFNSSLSLPYENGTLSYYKNSSSYSLRKHRGFVFNVFLELFKKNIFPQEIILYKHRA